MERRSSTAGRYPDPEQQVFVSLLTVHQRVMNGLAALLKEHGLSEPQYNALRILRGAGSGGLPCRVVASRMITRFPDITRLLDRLEDAGLILRERGSRDRRVVTVKILPEGLDLLERLDEPVRRLHRGQFGHLSKSELSALNRLLVQAAECEAPSSHN